MTNEEILKKVIGKVEKNGYKRLSLNNEEVRIDKYDDEDIWFEEWDGRRWNITNYEKIIFSHDFAKAFWGEKQETQHNSICLHCGNDIGISNPSGYCNHIHYPESCEICLNKSKDWQYHLQQLILEEEPLKYLEKFL